jgi:PTH1 family peptidyl-tRNA hydrolase
MKIIACLGNPGNKYTNTRHNIGFFVGEYLAYEYNISLSKKNFQAVVGTGKIEGSEVLLLLPQTYMNNSGQSVQAALSFYKTDVSDLIVVHDEIELTFGDCRIKKGGGHKGHNGLRSIINLTGSADFDRMRFGVGRPENPNIPVADYVLGDFTGSEVQRIKELLPEVSSDLIKLIKGL